VSGQESQQIQPFAPAVSAGGRGRPCRPARLFVERHAIAIGAPSLVSRFRHLRVRPPNEVAADPP